MFERTRDYPTALTSSSAGNADAVKAAVSWLLTKAREIGGQPLLYFPGKSNMSAEPLLEQLSQRVSTATWRTLRGGKVGWSGGVVLAAWPDEQHLAEIADDRRTKGLVVLAWSDNDVAGWAAAAQPEVLNPDVEVGTASVCDPVVAKGLETLTALVNHGNALAGTLDRRDAIMVLQKLHDGGHRLDPDEVYAWSLAHGWPARGALRLKEIASRIAAGSRPHPPSPSALRPDILSVWRAQVAGEAQE